MAKRIKMLKPRAIALVKNPATRIHFYVIRSEPMFDELKKLAEEWMGKEKYESFVKAVRAEEEPAEGEEPSEEAGEISISKEAAEQIKTIIEVFKSWKDDLPNEVIAAVGALAALIGEPEVPSNEQKSSDIGVRMLDDKDFVEKLIAKIQERIMPKIKEEMNAELESGLSEIADALGNK